MLPRRIYSSNSSFETCTLQYRDKHGSMINTSIMRSCNQGHQRIVKWFGLEEALKTIWLQPLWHGQGHPLEQVAQNSIQSGLEHSTSLKFKFILHHEAASVPKAPQSLGPLHKHSEGQYESNSKRNSPLLSAKTKQTQSPAAVLKTFMHSPVKYTHHETSTSSCPALPPASLQHLAGLPW